MEYPNDYPSVEDVIGVTITTSDGQSTDVYGFSGLVMQIQQVEPTRKLSVNDGPTVGFYYKIELITEDKAYYYYVYEENSSVYLEIPYVGIYKGIHTSGNNSMIEMIVNLIVNDPIK